MCDGASAMVGSGPVHFMPACMMRPSPPRMYRLHSAAPAAASPAAADVAAAAGGGGPRVLPKRCAEAQTTSQQDKMAIQHAAGEALAPLHTRSSGNSGRRAGAVIGHLLSGRGSVDARLSLAAGTFDRGVASLCQISKLHVCTCSGGHCASVKERHPHGPAAAIGRGRSSSQTSSSTEHGGGAIEFLGHT